MSATTDSAFAARVRKPTPGPSAWPRGVKTLGYGGDYNPEQWPREVRKRDLELMQEAGVNFVSLGIFAWAQLEPREGEYTFEWLDEVMDDLDSIGVKVALATATAAPPPWLTTKHPEILPYTASGVAMGQGARQSYCPNSPLFGEYATGITRKIAERYADHPALALWHVDNELGCHNFFCYSTDCETAFRTWLANRYGDIAALNEAWGTAFWSQRYDNFAQVQPPRVAPTLINPTQQLDYLRFLSDSQRGFYARIVAVLREVTPEVPATTNFMISNCKNLDYLRFGAEVDVVANDHYTEAANPERHIDLAFAADLTRAVARGNPWILMEHSTSAVNWQPVNRAKPDGEMLRNSLNHVARGADSVMFFQFRQSHAGSEKFHSAMVPHAERDSVVWRNTVRLGAALKAIAEVKGATLHSDVAIMFDYEAWWAVEIDSKPSTRHLYRTEVNAAYRELWQRSVPVDFVHPSDDLSTYKLIIVPALYLIDDAAAQRIHAAAKAGATVLVTYFSGIVNEHDHIYLGGYPGAFKTMLGIHVDEFYPLLTTEPVTLDDGSQSRIWSERIETRGATATRHLASGSLTGCPAITRNVVDQGVAWYQGVDLSQEAQATLYDDVLRDAGCTPLRDVSAGVEIVRRQGMSASYLFIFNHTDAMATVPASGHELLRDHTISGTAHVAAGDVAVIREEPTH